MVLPPGLLEEIQGDLNEAFYERVAARGLARARLLFILDVFRFIRPFTLQRDTPRYAPPHPTDMLSNYSKIAWRNLAKNKSTRQSTLRASPLAWPAA
jgi:hypothetical protein